MTTTSTVVFITGAGRGIGKGLVEAYLRRPNHTVIGSVRDSSSPSYTSLKATPTAPNTRLLLVSLDASQFGDPAKAIAAVQEAGITHLDIVIANAGISPAACSLDTAPLNEVVDALTINAVSPMALYQASKPLLEKSAKPIWISISSAAGSIANAPAYQTHWLLGYASSKAALNWFTMAIHAANPRFIAYALHPGLVQTSLGDAGAKMQGLERAPVTVEDSCARIIASADAAERETSSGKFFNIVDDKEKEIPW